MGIASWWQKLTNRDERGSNDVLDWMFHWLTGDPGQSGNNKKTTVRNDGYDEKIKEDVLPYVPGGQQAQAISDSVRYWNDYEKNTGKKRRYPGLQTHSPDVGDVVNGFDWWIDW